VPEWRWSSTEQMVFDQLKRILSEPPILAYPNFEIPFELHTGASTKALGAVLYYEQDGVKRVISYASRALAKSERNYSAFKLEFLALKWSITEKFSDYLTGNHFTVYTDNNPLTHVLTSAKLDATGQRWASALGHFSFDVIYRACHRNADADGMSRFPYDRVGSDQDMVKVTDSTVKAICSCFHVTQSPHVMTLPALSLKLVDTLEEQGQVLAQKELREIRSLQRQDPVIERWRISVIDQVIPTKTLMKEDMQLKKQFKNLFMKRGVLFRKVFEEDEVIEHLVIPEACRKEFLMGLHDNVGHPGSERTMKLLRERFYWPGMTVDVDQWVKRCNRCLRRKDENMQRVPRVSVDTTYPLELVCIDYLSLEPAKGVGNILVITDHFTKYALAVPTRNQTAKTTAEALFNEFIIHYGIPTRIHSDQGANFESELIRKLCILLNIKKSHKHPTIPKEILDPKDPIALYSTCLEL